MSLREGLREELTALLPFATERQGQYIYAYLEHGSQEKAAKSLGVHKKTIFDSIDKLKRRAARQGHAPSHDMTKTVPDGYIVKGVSTLYDSDGAVSAQWVKSQIDRERQAELQRLFVQELVDSVTPKRKTKPPKVADKELLVGYPLGDHHFGMHAWGLETGGDYDIKIAKQLLEDSVDYLVSSAPPAHSALFCNLGDLLHIDNRTNRTPQSGHVLDVDSRYARIIRVAAYGMAYGIERLLEKHKHVKVVNVPGNHDLDSASWVSFVLEAYFRKEPRVTVETSPARFVFHQFGKNMIGMTHGDANKLPELPSIMAAYEPEMWGATTYRVIWTGHVHHRQQLSLKEDRGARAESFGVLPPNDAYGASRGFLANREMHAIVFKRAGGEQGRITYNVGSE